jgi:hypothetical protein
MLKKDEVKQLAIVLQQAIFFENRLDGELKLCYNLLIF